MRKAGHRAKHPHSHSCDAHPGHVLVSKIVSLLLDGVHSVQMQVATAVVGCVGLRRTRVRGTALRLALARRGNSFCLFFLKRLLSLCTCVYALPRCAGLKAARVSALPSSTTPKSRVEATSSWIIGLQQARKQSCGT
jgi:hypothetical protein